jgi:hypothetical protein
VQSCEQHSPSEAQAFPALWQAVVRGAHFPLVQVPLQQAASDVQARLSETHAAALHFPPEQLSVQHSVEEPQLAPLGAQVVVLAAQVCDLVSQSAEQQSAPDWQMAPYL